MLKDNLITALKSVKKDECLTVEDIAEISETYSGTIKKILYEQGRGVSENVMEKILDSLGYVVELHLRQKDLTSHLD